MKMLNIVLAFGFACLASPLSHAAELTNSTVISITKTWSQEPGGWTYPMSISVPSGDVPAGGFPVCVLLHGNGGNGPAMINNFQATLGCHALVAPSGYLASWNICGENSDAPDLEMVAELVSTLQGFDNVNAGAIRLLGFSNGAGLANSVFIENGNAGIDAICTVVSQLNEPQYHLGAFHRASGPTSPPTPFCGYDTIVTPPTGRKYLSVCNTNDPIIPYNGGPSPVGVPFLNAETAAYRIAQSQGHTGAQVTVGTQVATNVYEYSYLSGAVVHLRGNAAHGINVAQREYIVDFLDGCNVAAPCPEDLDGSGAVDFGDIVALLAAWGPCGAPCDEDINTSGAVDFDDLLIVLSAWGPCS